MEQKTWIGIIGIMLIIVFGGIWSGAIDISGFGPFAAIAPGQIILPNLTVGESRSYNLQVCTTSTSSAISEFWYRVEFYEAGTDTIVGRYPTSGWQDTNTGVGVNACKNFNFPVPDAVKNTAGKYAVLVYVSDSGSSPDPAQWTGFLRSAYDTTNQANCLADPAYWGCTTTNKATCCIGSGYWQYVGTTAVAEYHGSLTIS